MKKSQLQQTNLNKRSSFYAFAFIALFAAIILYACQGTPLAPDKTTHETSTQLINSEKPDPSPTVLTNTPAQKTYPTNTPNATTAITITPTPDMISLNTNNLVSTLDEDVEWHVLIKDLDTQQRLMEINPGLSVNPASTIKVPLAMAVLAKNQTLNRSLEDLKNIGIEGRSFHALLYATIVHSEEKATQILEYFARGDDFLPNILSSWGLKETFFNPRRSSCEDLARILEGLNDHSFLGESFSEYLIGLMLEQTVNDSKYLGVLVNELPGATFANKRGTMGSPTSVGDHGILSYKGKTWIIVIIGTPNEKDTATIESIGISIERFAAALASQLEVIVSSNP